MTTKPTEIEEAIYRAAKRRDNDNATVRVFLYVVLAFGGLAVLVLLLAQ